MTITPLSMSGVLNFKHFIGGCWNFFVALMCISLSHMMLFIFPYTCFASSFVNCLLGQFANLIGLLFYYCEILNFLCIFWIQVFIRQCFADRFPPVCGLSFYFLNGTLCRLEVFNFSEVPLASFLGEGCFWCHISPNPRSLRFSLVLHFTSFVFRFQSMRFFFSF